MAPRRRIVVSLVAAGVVGYWYFRWAVDLGRNLVDYYRLHSNYCASSIAFCIGSARSVVVGWAALIVVSFLGLGLAWLVARWSLAPLRAVTDQVQRFGPMSLGLRIDADGPNDETRRLADAVDAMLDRLTEGYEAQRRFAANASHELRTPLATQRALIEISLTAALTPDQLDLVTRQLLATNERNERLIDGLLTLAETERGRMANSPLRLDHLAAQVLERQQAAADQRRLRLDGELAPVTVSGELPLLDRLVSNLVENAVKYNEPGGSVHVGLTQDGVLTVVNTGPVVLPDQVSGLFEPFRRLSGDRLEHGGGVGLGLTIARSIVTAHGGAIEARPNPRGGLHVAVALTPGT